MVVVVAVAAGGGNSNEGRQGRASSALSQCQKCHQLRTGARAGSRESHQMFAKQLAGRLFSLVGVSHRRRKAAANQFNWMRTSSKTHTQGLVAGVQFIFSENLTIAR